MRARRRDEELDPSELESAAVLRFALRRFHAASDRVVRSAGLTPRSYLLLLAIESSTARRRRTTIGDLATVMDLAQSTVTELLDRAELAGLVERRRASGDGRVVHVTATAEGRRLFRRAFRALQAERESLVRALEPVALEPLRGKQSVA